MFDRVADVGGRHVGRRDERAAGLVPVQPAEEPGLAAAGEKGAPERFLLKFERQVLPVLAGAEQAVEPEAILGEIGMRAVFEVGDDFSKHTPGRQAVVAVAGVGRFEVRHFFPDAGADQNDAFAALRDPVVSRVVQVE